MVRTRASNAASKAVAAKAPRKVAPAPAPAKKSKSKGSKSGSGRLPPITKQPIPGWQRSVGTFFKSDEPSSSKDVDPATEEMMDENAANGSEHSEEETDRTEERSQAENEEEEAENGKDEEKEAENGKDDEEDD
ncbi:PCNA-associated factor-like [Schistocerca gregaria]|uniref:PCNA-associated factor-like n=1 Tax=Schistocerca gregaria TaxID=7010 RepID=UPI00211EDD5A|nr:PCNA-associated factor-like [Schistocerca gregaria]